jgi:hypothetical protein
MTDQYGIDYELNSVEGHGEMPEPVATPLSQRAINGMKPPRYWDRAGGAMESQGGRTLGHAIWKVQGKVKPIIEADASNPFTKKSYASLGMLLATIRPVLHDLDIVIRQGAGKIIAYGTSQKEFFLPVWMDIQHVPSGESDRVMLEVPLSKLDAQAIGIAITYGRRYLLQSYFGVASMDDDAASAVQKRLDKDEEAGAVAGIIEKIRECKTAADLEKWHKANQAGIQHLSDEALGKCRTAYKDRLQEIQDASQEPETTKKAK